VWHSSCMWSTIRNHHRSPKKIEPNSKTICWRAYGSTTSQCLKNIYKDGSWTNSRTRKFKITHNFNDSIYTGKNINGPKKIDPYIYPSLPKGMLTFSDILREYGVGSLLPKVNSFFFIGKIYYLYQYIERNPFDIDFFYCHFCPSLYSNIVYVKK
jgi:hypothetical protein